MKIFEIIIYFLLIQNLTGKETNDSKIVKYAYLNFLLLNKL